ncbi:MAG: alpha/beta hydrolase [Sphingomonadales bacterium]|nr:alpha/beta hydrolase [Sphingomonadales bacterium]
MNDYTDGYWLSEDGLRLHYRDYPAHRAGIDAARPPIVCLHGLTRNARDFETLAASLAGKWRVICPEMRGRGDSAYSRNWSTYQPLQYVSDVRALLDQAGIDRFIAIGTSLGGLMTMILALIEPDRIVGAALNDIGPAISPEGLEKILDYVGQGRNFPTWMHAARALEEIHAGAHPTFAVADWLAMAKRTMTLGSNGRIVFDYDMKIAEPFAQAKGAPATDLWPGFDALLGKPLLMLRGALSDLLSPEVFAEMRGRATTAEALVLADVGHAPTLDEPEARAAIARLLARVEAAQAEAGA